LKIDSSSAATIVTPYIEDAPHYYKPSLLLCWLLLAFALQISKNEFSIDDRKTHFQYSMMQICTDVAGINLQRKKIAKLFHASHYYYNFIRQVELSIEIPKMSFVLEVPTALLFQPQSIQAH
jgi:hypothetical protein